MSYDQVTSAKKQLEVLRDRASTKYWSESAPENQGTSAHIHMNVG
jgi:hypothetical protein